MRNTIFIFLLLLPCFAFSQKVAGRYYSQEGQDYYFNIILKYPNGDLDTLTKFIDKTETLQDLKAEVEAISEYAQRVAIEALGIPGLEDNIARTSDAVEVLTGKEVWEHYADQYGSAAVGSWEVSQDGGVNWVNATVTYSPGSLEMTVGANTYPVYTVNGVWVKIGQFNGGVDLFKMGPAFFASLEGKYQLRKQ